MRLSYSILLLVLAIGMLPIVESSQEPQCDSYLPPVALGECKELIMTCENCTFVNITKIYYPQTNGSSFNLNVPMTKFVNNYNYTFCDNNYLGTYWYSTIGNLDGQIEQGNVCYVVTPSGTIFTNALSIPLFLPMVLMIIMAVFSFILSKLLAKEEYRLAFIIMAGVFLVFAIAFGIIASRETLFGFPLLFNFVNSFYRIFIIVITAGAILTVLILMFYIVKKAFDSRGYNPYTRSSYA